MYILSIMIVLIRDPLYWEFPLKREIAAAHCSQALILLDLLVQGVISSGLGEAHCLHGVAIADNE